MNFFQFKPDARLGSIIECYWIVEGNEIFLNKIIPDGCPEIIFHFEDPYQVQCTDSTFSTQPLAIVAGQLTQPLFIRPSGKSGVLGIKFKATGLWKLFACNMKMLKNETLPLEEVTGFDAHSFIAKLKHSSSHEERIKLADELLLEWLSQVRQTHLDEIVIKIQLSGGQLSITRLCEQEKISIRKVERSFNEVVGISPKVYMRLIRFNRVFKLIQQPDLSKAESTYLCGYFDQAHFNKDFRTFSGEDPGTYFKNNHAFSNFFMNR